ncbi:MAG: ABC transporter ATP-binding protein [Clostridiales bacterium]|nr:ABC transporter ATP-binding protein [Clostridiales bacterium]
MENKILIDGKNISIGFLDPKTNNIHNVVKNISFQVKKGEILGVVGESGSGKSMTVLSMMGLLAKDAVINGSIVFDGKDILKLNEEDLRKLKGKEMSMVFQEPMTSLNPSMKVGRQVEEMLILHEPNLNKEARKKKTIEALGLAGLSNGEIIFDKYPHQLSGGMRQRVMIAMAMICKPKVLIADEPTTALDVTTQATILDLLKEISKTNGTTVILISHDLSVIKKICNRVLVMEDGNIVEEGNIKDIFTNPKKSYTKKLLKAIPIVDLDIELKSRENERKKPSKTSLVTSELLIESKTSDKEKREKILEVRNLNVYYQEKTGFFNKETRNHVVKDLSLYVNKGETLGIVGESGSGKSTLSKAIVGMIDDYDGDIILPNIKPQMVFQDPYSSLNPVKKVGWILEEPLKLQSKLSKEERRIRVNAILREVDLDEGYADRYLSELSGGQRQRVAIGASLILNPEFIVLDEPVSALDVTVQHQIIELLKRLKDQFNLSYLFISHDLNVVYQICDRVCVMYNGEIVERAPIKELFMEPQHEYTKRLLKSVI